MDPVSPIGPRLPDPERVAPVEAVRISVQEREPDREDRRRRRREPASRPREDADEDRRGVDVRA
jgi:hypothetical protein